MRQICFKKERVLSPPWLCSAHSLYVIYGAWLAPVSRFQTVPIPNNIIYLNQIITTQMVLTPNRSAANSTYSPHYKGSVAISADPYFQCEGAGGNRLQKILILHVQKNRKYGQVLLLLYNISNC